CRAHSQRCLPPRTSSFAVVDGRTRDQPPGGTIARPHRACRSPGHGSKSNRIGPKLARADEVKWGRGNYVECDYPASTTAKSTLICCYVRDRCFEATWAWPWVCDQMCGTVRKGESSRSKETLNGWCVHALTPDGAEVCRQDRPRAATRKTSGAG